MVYCLSTVSCFQRARPINWPMKQIAVAVAKQFGKCLSCNGNFDFLLYSTNFTSKLLTMHITPQGCPYSHIDICHRCLFWMPKSKPKCCRLSEKGPSSDSLFETFWGEKFLSSSLIFGDSRRCHNNSYWLTLTYWFRGQWRRRSVRTSFQYPRMSDHSLSPDGQKSPGAIFPQVKIDTPKGLGHTHIRQRWLIFSPLNFQHSHVPRNIILLWQTYNSPYFL